MLKPWRWIFLISLLFAAPFLRAGESGLNVIVVVNQTSSNSLQLGNDYCEKRGVPPQNVLRINGWSGDSTTWTESQFETFLLNPLNALVSSNNLSDQIQIVLLSMDIPYRVVNDSEQSNCTNSTTSAIYYGLKNDTTAPAGLPNSCSLPPESTNSYYTSELTFDFGQPDTATNNSYLAVMLTGTNLAMAEATLQYGSSSDSTFPSNTIYLEKTDDTARNVRFILFDNAIQECRARGGDNLVRTNSDSTGWTNSMGLETGLSSFSLPPNAFIPGAVADDLTSFSGYILEGQPGLITFLEAGATGSYGTVVEPCNYTFKFPNPMVYFYQNRGFCVAESYYQSLANPYQGLIGGEPLAAPFAHRGVGTWSSPAAGAVLSNTVPLNISFTAASSNLPLSQVDLFVDGTFYETVTNLPLAPGNVLSVTVNGTPATYTVSAGDTLATAAGSLATQAAYAFNMDTNAFGDRVLLRSEDVTTLGSAISVKASASIGSASALTSFATASLPTFLDSTAYGEHLLLAANNPAVGDYLKIVFTKTNNSQVTVAVTNTVSGTTIATFLQDLMNQIAATPALQTANGVNASDLLDSWYPGYWGFLINASTPGWQAAQIKAVFTASSDIGAEPGGSYTLQDNEPDLQPRAHIYLSAGALSLQVSSMFDTSLFADGFHVLTAVAYEGTSVATQTRAAETVQFRNTSLAASFVPLPPDANGDLQFAVNANASDITQIQLLSTGGSMTVASNQPSAILAASAATLGVGLHPFYALVTDSAGHQYQTQTIWEQVPALQLGLTGPPQSLVWTTIPGRQYNILTSTNLTAAYHVAATVLATGSQEQWPITAPSSGALYYRVSVTP